MSLLRLLRTVYFLKPSQIYRRLYFNYYPVYPKLTLPLALAALPGTWQQPIAKAPVLVAKSRVRLLAKEAEINTKADWQAVAADALWRYQLHYFDDLTAVDSSSRSNWQQALIAHWLDSNPPTIGVGWEPYPISLRVVNWIKWALAGNPLSAQAQHSLLVQLDYLSKRMEYHLLGNHLLANAKALVFGGLYFSGNHAQSWLRTGLAIINQQLAQQILADGGHIEGSGMYHALVSEDILDLINILQAYRRTIEPSWFDYVSRLLSWLWTMTHPDGDFAFVNDCALQASAQWSQLQAYAIRLDLPMAKPVQQTKHLIDSGYVRLQLDSSVAVLDIAPIGPDYLPAHSHADSLTFEYSYQKQRIIVNSGTSLYQAGPERSYQRSTAAHNTVVIDEQDSSEVWSSFRVGRRARIIESQVDTVANKVVAAHNGYRHLAGRPIHRRTWVLTADRFTIDDEITGKGAHTLKWYLHFHPQVTVQLQADSLQITSVVGKLKLLLPRQLQYNLVASHYYPKFGEEIPNQTIIGSWHGELPLQLNSCLLWDS